VLLRERSKVPKFLQQSPVKFSKVQKSTIGFSENGNWIKNEEEMSREGLGGHI
jgi:hypothetical protein